jgi:anaerobic selenocysteine-containing dehydrogenase
LFLLNALLGAVAVPGGFYPNGWNKVSPKTPVNPARPAVWNDLHLPLEYPLAMYELSYLLPHFLAEGRGRIDTYFTRVYNPVWTNPDGFSWIEALTDHDKVGCHVALTPTWNETAYFADYVLPMGHSSERHDIVSGEQYDGQWIGFRQPVLRAARERLGETVTDTRQTNPGEVWEENEFWIELTWRIDSDGSLGIRRHYEAPDRPGQKMTVDDYYGWVFTHGVPGLPEAAAAEELTPLAYMRRYGGFEVSSGVGQIHEEPVPDAELDDVRVSELGRVYSRAPAPNVSYATGASPDPDAEGRRAAGVMVDGVVRRGFPTPSGRLEFWSSTLAAWGWREYALPTYIRSHVHPARLADDEVPLISTFRLPVQIHTRSANAKWLNELAHTNPLWIHPSHARRLDIATGDLVRVETRAGHYVVKAWVTEGIRPGVVACSHHMGRWKPRGETEGHDRPRQRMQTSDVTLDNQGNRWRLADRSPHLPSGDDPDLRRVWWSDIGVHQNMTFPVHPDPISGQHCWHQAVRIRRAEPSDAYGDVVADTARMREIYREWLAKTRSADVFSPTGERRPHWLQRPLRPQRAAWALPADRARAPDTAD